jgi:hypothetical protein
MVEREGAKEIRKGVFWKQAKKVAMAKAIVDLVTFAFQYTPFFELLWFSISTTIYHNYSIYFILILTNPFN